MNEISFNLANIAYRQAGYPGVDDWGVACRTTRLHLTPIETYETRLEEILAEAQGTGLDAVDFWTELCAVRWCTDEHVRIAREVLDRRGMRAITMVGGFGDDREQLDHNFKIARALGARILSGGTPLLATDRDHVVAKLEEYDLVLALENHPQSAEEMLAQVGDGANGRIGTCAETGWFGVAGFDAVQSVRTLGDSIVNVHLKDVKYAHRPHETCRFGQGVVDIEGCVRALMEMGYTGAISVEHEPEDHDPFEDVIAGVGMLRGWLEGKDRVGS